MHRSKLNQIVIDVPEERWEAASDFWCAALGARPHPENRPGQRYHLLVAENLGLRILLQRVEWSAGYHLDIESDDVEAEVRRLEALGARRKRAVKSWVVMESPTGHDFCVIREQEGFAEGAVEWEDGARPVS